MTDMICTKRPEVIIKTTIIILNHERTVKVQHAVCVLVSILHQLIDLVL